MERRPMDTSSESDFGKAPAKHDEVEKYREQMTRMFGSTDLPAVTYKGDKIGKRTL